MASLVKQPTSKYYTAAFRDSKGRQCRRTTRETDKKRAQATANKYELAAKGQGNLARVRRTINEFLRDHFGGNSSSVTVEDFIHQWIAARKVEVTPGSFNLYKTNAEKFLTFLGPNARVAMEDITKAQIVAFRDTLADNHSPATANNTLHGIRRIFRTARIDGIILADPSEGVSGIKTQNARSKKRPFTVDELNRVIAVADDEWRSMVRFGIYTGQRLGDLALLTWAQIDLMRNEITMTTRKTKRQLVLPIIAPLRDHILTLESGDDPRALVHPRAYGMYFKKGSQLSGQFVDILYAAGLREHPHSYSSRHGQHNGGRRQTFELSFHSLRHTTNSLLKDAGIPDATIMALIGHENPKMSARYTHVGKEALAQAAGTLPRI